MDRLRASRVLSCLVVVIAVASRLVAATAAQHSSSTIVVHGKVTTPDGAAVAGAVASATAQQGQAVEHTATTAADGSFVWSLEPGEYVVIAEKGSLDSEARTISVAAGQEVDVALVLDLRVLHAAITVEAPGGYRAPVVTSATRTSTPLIEVPQSVNVVTQALMRDQLMVSLADVVRYLPGVGAVQGENNRDQVVIRGNGSSADFYLDGLRDDVQYYRDLFDIERVEALKGPNALVFGRGGGGGVINRVTKRAGFDSFGEVALEGGSRDARRGTIDLDHAFNDRVALRVNGMNEDSGSFRDGVTLRRDGFAPTMTLRLGDDSDLAVGYEHLHDRRVADRGITSFRGLPADVPIATYYGDPEQTFVRADVDLAWAALTHRIGDLELRNRTLLGDYDRGYQNFVPGATAADRSAVLLSAYNNATRRRNLFNQTDLAYTLETGAVRHSLLAGIDLGRQISDNFRNTGYFGGTATSVSVPFDDPFYGGAVTWRQSATDADNHVQTKVASAFVQDQAALGAHVRIVGGVRVERFDQGYHNNRDGSSLGRVDDLVSPRLGIVLLPNDSLSFYGSYSVSYLPGSGDQFSSLTNVTAQLEPERFGNVEVGAKWQPLAGLGLNAAVYRLDRTNTRATDPNDPTRIVQTGSQRTNGFELGVDGQVTSRWSIAGGMAWQDAFVTHATASARQGATVAQVPRQTLSLWNDLQVTSRLHGAVGIVHRSRMFAAIDDSVVLPGFTRLDAAVLFDVTAALRLQVNVENVLDTRYFTNADNNTNISPGAPRTVRVGLTARM